MSGPLGQRSFGYRATALAHGQGHLNRAHTKERACQSWAQPDGWKHAVPLQKAANEPCSEAELTCLDLRDDRLFYSSPHFVQHVDDGFRSQLRELYAAQLAPGARVLELAASWDSHLPRALAGRLSVVGQGMNEAELRANGALSEHFVQDLNLKPQLIKLADASFDAVVMCNGVQYMRRPGALWPEVARVLRPGGKLIVSFSSHCYTEKAFSGWLDRSMAQRAELVQRYLALAGFRDVAVTLREGPPGEAHSDTIPETIDEHTLEEARAHHHQLRGTHDPFCAIIARAPAPAAPPHAPDAENTAPVGFPASEGLRALQSTGLVPHAAQALQELDLLSPAHPVSEHTLERWRTAYRELAGDARAMGIPGSVIPVLPDGASAADIRAAREHLSNMIASFTSSCL